MIFRPRARRLVLSLFLLSFSVASSLSAQAVRRLPGFSRQSIPRNDDGSAPATSLGFTINFFGRERSTAFVNNNGNITFDASLATFTPFGLTGTRREIIAAYFADVDTRPAGSQLVTYGTDTIDGRNAFGANYINVGYYNQHADKLNTFQIVLIDRSETGPGNFDIEFNYERVSWETGDASGGTAGFGGTPAAVGWSNGTGLPGTFYELDGSFVSGAFLDSGSRALARRRLNSTVTGRYAFRARNGFVIPPLAITSSGALPPGTVREPYSLIMSSVGGMAPFTWSLIPDPGATLPGLSLSPLGVLSGTPTAPGTFDFTLQLTARTEDGNQTVTKRASLTITAPALTISGDSCLLPAATAGAAYSHRLTASGGLGSYVWSWGTGPQVPGLTLSGDGHITGTPAEAGNYTFLVRVAPQAGDVAEASERACRLTVRPAPVETTVASCPAAAGTVDVPYAHDLSVAGGMSPYRWSAAGALPTGLSLNPEGRLTGIPSVAGSFTFNLTATDRRGQTATQSCAIEVSNPSVSIATSCPLPAATLGQAYSQQLTATEGEGPYTWSAAGTIPPGLTLRGDGLLSGRPMSAGPFGFRIVVADSQGRTAARPCNLAVSRTALSVASCPLPPARAGRVYDQLLAAVGGIEPYLWSVEGAVPAGLTLSASGQLRGVPTTAGNASLALLITDSRGLTVTQSCDLSILPEPLRIESACPSQARVGTPMQYRAIAAGGRSPYQWSVRGDLPEGLRLAADGTLSGAATSAGDAAFDLVVTDSLGERMARSCVLPVRLPEPPPIRLSGIPSVVAPATSMPRIVVSLSSAYPLAIEGEITLSITPDTVSPEAEVNQADANVRFLNGQRKATFSLAPGALRTEIPIASSGTVASTISVAITRLTAAGADLLLLPPALRFRVERLAPVITDACYAPTSTGLMLQVTGYSTTRELAAAEVNVGQGAPVSVNVNAITTDYYLNEVSVRTGGAFTIEFPVSLSAAGSSVSVRLRNSAGASASRPARRCN